MTPVIGIVDDDASILRAIRRLLVAAGFSVRTFGSAEEFVSFFRTWYGPTLKAFAALDDAGRESLESDLIALVDQYDRLCGGAVAIPATYTEAVARKR